MSKFATSAPMHKNTASRTGLRDHNGICQAANYANVSVENARVAAVLGGSVVVYVAAFAVP